MNIGVHEIRRQEHGCAYPVFFQDRKRIIEKILPSVIERDATSRFPAGHIPRRMFQEIKAFFQGNDYSMSVYQRSESFELPTQLRIGASYDFLIGEWNRITLAGNFTSNSFSKDQFTLGLEYSLKEYLILHGAYTYEDGITYDVNDPNRTNAYKGLSLGATVEIPISKKSGVILGIDYAYQSTDNFKGTQAFGIRLKY